MLTVPIHLAEEPNPILPVTGEIIVGFIAFGLLYWVLQKYAFPIFERTFAERTAAIEGGLERAERAQAEADAALENYQAQLAEARAEAALGALPPGGQAIARRTFLRLIQFGEGRADTRRQQTVSALRTASDDSSVFDQTLWHLTDNRLFTLSGEEGKSD